MATMDDRQVKLLDDVAHLDDIGEKRAFDLLAVSHLKSGPTADVPVVALVTKLFAVVGLLPALRKLLLVTAPSPVVTPSQLEIISDHIRSCHALLCKIDAVVCETDKLLGRTAALDPQSAFGRQEQHNALTLLTTCFHDIAVIVSAARASHLERFGYLTDDQTFECLRLREALTHPDFRLCQKASQPETAALDIGPPQLNQPSSFQNHLLESMAELKLVPEGNIPSSSSVHSPEMTPATTRRSTPGVDSDRNVAAANEERQWQLVNSFQEKQTFDGEKGEANTTASHPTPTTAEADEKPDSDSIGPQQPITNTAPPPVDQTPEEPSATQQNDASNSSSTSSPPPVLREIYPTSLLKGLQESDAGNLEAYILRPLCENSYEALEWSYKIQLLPLQNPEVEAHMKTLGPEYSVLNSVGDLLPEELRLVLIKVKNRSGNLVSVQRTRDVDLVTKMGTFKVQSVIFVLRTTKAPESEALKGPAQYSAQPSGNLFTNAHPAPPFGGFGANNTNNSGGLFSNSPFSLGFRNNNTGGFGSGFGNSNTTGFGSGFSNNNTSGFGGFANNNTTAGFGGGFGNNNTTGFGGGFGNNNTRGFGGGFGNNNTTGFVGGFGNNNTTGFGGGFGNNNTTGFGGGFANNNTSGFGGGFGNNNTSGFGGGFANNNTTTGFGGGFGNVPIQPNVGPGLFGRPASPARPPHIGTERPGYKPHVWEVDATQYLTKIKNEGDVCQYIEYDNSRPHNGIQHFQAITFNPQYRYYSFEELRLWDQAEGRTGPKPAFSFAEPIPMASSTDGPPSQPNINSASLGGGGLFGLPSSSTANQAPLSYDPHSQWPPSRLGEPAPTIKHTITIENAPKPSGAAPSQPLGPGLFGSWGPKPGTAPGPDLFASTRPTATGGGLFGNYGTVPAMPSNRPFFEARQPAANNPPPRSLFGSTPPPANNPTPTSVFGTVQPAANNPPPSSLFGNTKPAVANPLPKSLFSGAQLAASNPPPTSGFGNPKAVVVNPHLGSLFGTAQPSSSNPPTTSGFGDPKPAVVNPHLESLFGSARPSTSNPPSTLNFGDPMPAANNPTPGSLFGNTKPAVTNAQPTSSLFGSAQPAASEPQSTTLRGRAQPPANNPPGTSLSANNKPSTSTGLFGPAPPAVASSSLPPFGSVATSQANATQQQQPSGLASNPGPSTTQSAFGATPANNTTNTAPPGAGLFGSSYIPPRK